MCYKSIISPYEYTHRLIFMTYDNKKRTSNTSIALLEDEKQLINNVCGILGTTLSSFVRSAALREANILKRKFDGGENDN